MSEFSKEYIEYTKLTMGYDFSYMEFFSKMKSGESQFHLCEGFGTIGIKNIDGVPFLVKSNGQEVNLAKLMQEDK